MKSSTPSDEAVLKATGKNWKQWFTILDKAGAKTMNHTDIARHVYSKHLAKRASGGWWSQMVTVQYERARGLRKVNEEKDGFRVSVSKTIPGTVAHLQKQWNGILKSKPVAALQPKRRATTTTKYTVMRYDIKTSRITLAFDSPSKGKARIIMEVTKLPNKSSVEITRKFWKDIFTKHLK